MFKLYSTRPVFFLGVTLDTRDDFPECRRASLSAVSAVLDMCLRGGSIKLLCTSAEFKKCKW